MKRLLLIAAAAVLVGTGSPAGAAGHGYRTTVTVRVTSKGVKGTLHSGDPACLKDVLVRGQVIGTGGPPIPMGNRRTDASGGFDYKGLDLTMYRHGAVELNVYGHSAGGATCVGARVLHPLR